LLEVFYLSLSRIAHLLHDFTTQLLSGAVSYTTGIDSYHSLFRIGQLKSDPRYIQVAGFFLTILELIEKLQNNEI